MALRPLFAALLALLSVQAVLPSARVVTSTRVLCRTEAEQQAPREVRRRRATCPLRPPVPAFVSRALPTPDLAALFQRPPPASPRFR